MQLKTHHQPLWMQGRCLADCFQCVDSWHICNQCKCTSFENETKKKWTNNENVWFSFIITLFLLRWFVEFPVKSVINIRACFWCTIVIYSFWNHFTLVTILLKLYALSVYWNRSKSILNLKLIKINFSYLYKRCDKSFEKIVWHKEQAEK